MSQEIDNLDIYNKVREVPENALKPILGGRLKGKSDINPMWRIRMLTEQFGLCGIGWKYVITKQWIEEGANSEKAAFVNIDLYIKLDGAWSDPIPGNGGSMFVAKESGGLYTSDECFKMATTDAISVSCKALGFGADIYWNADSTKYSKTPQQGNQSGDKLQQNTGQNNQPTGQTNEVDKASKVVIGFGKYNGSTLSEIYHADPKYIQWLIDYDKTEQIIKKACQVLLKSVEEAKKKKQGQTSWDELTGKSLADEVDKGLNQTT